MSNDDRLHLVCTEEQKAAWQRAAEADRRTLSDWVRLQCDKAAAKR